MTDESAPEQTAKKTDRTPRKGGRQRDWTIRFLRELSRTFNVRHSCVVAGTTHDTVYRRRKRDPVFAKRWDDAYEDGRKRVVLSLEQTILDRALNGHIETVWHEGVEVGTRRVFNVAREIYLMKCLGGDRYKQDLIGASSSQEFDDVARKLVNAARTIEAEATVEVSPAESAPQLNGEPGPNP